MTAISFHSTSLQTLLPDERERLLALTPPPRHPGDEDQLVVILKAPKVYTTTLALVAVQEDQWIGWVLCQWRFNNQVAQIAIFVDPKYQGQGVGSALLRRIQLAMDALGMRLRGNATREPAARLFDRFGIENDARPREGV
jgi:GNAT superfamily N-acetyltransferase